MKERYSLGEHTTAFNAALALAGAEKWVSRIWKKDGSVWKSEPSQRRIIESYLGWLNVAEEIQGRLGEIQVATDEIRRSGFTTACLLGMGGSSLCPEVCAETFGSADGFLRLIALDTTDPHSIAAAQGQMDLARTLFIVASKSGGTLETLSQQKHFYEQLRRLKGEKAGDNFVAITDAGTSLEGLAREFRFFHTFLNPADIGGRFSALSFFGLVPMSLIGMDISRVIDRALAMAERCRVGTPPDANVALRLGTALGALALRGRDKLTFVLAPEIRTFGSWVEQLVAESTGKEGRGIVPVEGEPLGPASVYSSDRVFVVMARSARPHPGIHDALEALESAGHPVISREFEDGYDLAGEFFLWEFATAVAGAVLAINPFDQPNVQESKDNTGRLILEYEKLGSLDEGSPILVQEPFRLFAEASNNEKSDAGGLSGQLRRFLGTRRPGDYVALLAYLERSERVTEALQRLRVRIRHSTGCAVTIGFGPRFLHSTGQLHKGGPNNGIFLQITADDAEDLAIPGEKYSFGTLKRAQALGDLEALRKHGRRVIRLHLSGDVVGCLEELNTLLPN